MHTSTVSTQALVVIGPWFGRVKVDEVSSLVALEVILLVDLHREVEVGLTPLLTTKSL